MAYAKNAIITLIQINKLTINGVCARAQEGIMVDYAISGYIFGQI